MKGRMRSLKSAEVTSKIGIIPTHRQDDLRDIRSSRSHDPSSWYRRLIGANSLDADFNI